MAKNWGSPINDPVRTRQDGVGVHRTSTSYSFINENYKATLEIGTTYYTRSGATYCDIEVVYSLT